MLRIVYSKSTNVYHFAIHQDVATSLMFAVVGDHSDVVQLLLSSGAQVDLQNKVTHNIIYT